MTVMISSADLCANYSGEPMFIYLRYLLPRATFVARVLAAMTNVPRERLESDSPAVTQADFNRLSRAANLLHSRDIFISDTSSRRAVEDELRLYSRNNSGAAKQPEVIIFGDDAQMFAVRVKTGLSGETMDGPLAWRNFYIQKSLDNYASELLQIDSDGELCQPVSLLLAGARD